MPQFNYLENIILPESNDNPNPKCNPKLKPLMKAGIRKPLIFWSELLIIQLYVKKVYWSENLTVEYD